MTTTPKPCTMPEDGIEFEKSVQWKRKPIKTSENASKYRGVTWYKKTRTWRSRIGFEGKKIILGYFKCEEDAAKAYNDAALKYHGSLAILNEVGCADLVEKMEGNREILRT